MANAELLVTFAGPLVTIQDAGRVGNMRFGVAASGPMDRMSFDAANAALGNPAGRTALEVSLGGVMLTCKSGSVTLAVAGGDFAVEHAGQKAGSWTVLTLRKGEKLSLRAGKSGSWAYLAFAGTLASADWLGSQATHSTSGFGGGAVLSGTTLTIRDASVRDDRLGAIPLPDFQPIGAVRVVVGPQDQHFSIAAVDHLSSEGFRVTDAYDRMGMRLAGPSLDLNGALSIPSEPIVRGSIQVAGDGVPTILLADHQTTGGYPKIATVVSCDIDRLVQFRAGQTIRFKTVSPQTALTEVRDYAAARAKYLAQISIARGSLEQRLMRENLNHGFLFD